MRLLGVAEAAGGKAAVYEAATASGKVLIIFYVAGDSSRHVVLVPARPSPLCIRLSHSQLRAVRELLGQVGVEAGPLTACRVSSMLLRGSIRETLEAMREAGLLD